MSPTATRSMPAATPSKPGPVQVPQRDEALACAARAVRVVAPLWPLRHFVAVNPFLGVTGRRFADAAQHLGEVAGARLTMPRSFYREALASGRLLDRHLAAALRELRADPEFARALPADAAALRAAAETDAPAPTASVPTLAGVVGRLTERDLERFATERIAAWAASHFDQGQATWTSPWRELAPYAAWRAEASLDRTPDVLGLTGLRAAFARLPESAAELLASAPARLGVPREVLERYLERLVLGIAGWAAWARYHVWQSELEGRRDDTLLELLAVRLGWELALFETAATPHAREAWRGALDEERRRAAAPRRDPAVALDLALQSAYELGWQEGLLARFEGAPLAPAPVARPSAQAAFCIDVRSEVFRRALESTAPGVETIGFAGFFGFPIEYVPAGQEQGGAQCPVLLRPTVVVAEVLDGEHSSETAALGARRRRERWGANLWRGFKQGAVSCFGFVGPVGLVYGRKLLTDSLGMTRPVPHPAHDGVDPRRRAALGPTLALSSVADRATGLAPEQRLAMAETVLRAMSLDGELARLVLLAGHGSTTVNNPHATGLDCGACGGHTGEANARVAAAVLNDPEVRAGLAARGRPIPADTHFLAGLHDTTTDRVTIFERERVPASHRADLERLEAQLAEAGRRARAERAPALGLPAGADVDAAVLARSRDWSEVRPEWGLAGCAAFIAAPRERTRGLDLAGRSFLHSYTWRSDQDFAVLELILTAPVVVASWISLQYYGSTVDNAHFGCGDKVLHNVTGTLGVVEGNGGDLRSGLAWQSVHDGTRFVHEPIRLDVVIEAPSEAMTAILVKHAHVRELFDNGWLRLWAMDDTGRVSQRYAGGLAWSAVEARPQRAST